MVHDGLNESFALAKAAWVSDGGLVDEQSYRQQIKVVDERLALAGLRLAAVLNEVLGHVSPQESGTENPVISAGPNSGASV